MIRLVATALLMSLTLSAGAAAERPRLEKSTGDAALVAAKIVTQARVQALMPKIRKG